MAAATAGIVQQSSVVAFQAKSAPSSRKCRLSVVGFSFSGSFGSLKLSAGVTRKSPRRRRSGGRIVMMDVASTSYANALAEVAKSNGTLDKTSQEIEMLEKTLSDPMVFKFLTDPTVIIEKKREVIQDIAKALKLQVYTANFLRILVDARRLELIQDIVKEFEVAYNKYTDTELAIVTSVVKLESQHLAQIAKGVQSLTGAKNVRIKTVIDPSLIAGFTIRYGSSASKLIDMSVKKKLAEITAQLEFPDISLAV